MKGIKESRVISERNRREKKLALVDECALRNDLKWSGVVFFAFTELGMEEKQSQSRSINNEEWRDKEADEAVFERESIRQRFPPRSFSSFSSDDCLFFRK